MLKKTSWFPLCVSSGSIEALKWLGLLFMTIDHINRVFFDQGSYPAYCAGRLAMPLFAFVFAYNLARAEPISLEIYSKTSGRLVFFGLMATPAYLVMNKIEGLIPLNILFSFLIVLNILYFHGKGRKGLPLSAIFFVVGGIFVEYSWAVFLLCMSVWSFSKKPSFDSIFMGLTGFILLYILNGNNWGLAAIPIIVFAILVDLKIPRWHYFFWIYYPAHMTVFYLINRFFPWN